MNRPGLTRQVATGRQHAQTLLLLELASGLYINIPENYSTDWVFFGDWLNDKTIIFPHQDQLSRITKISEENLESFVSKKLFEDKINWFGFIDLSPNKNYAVYPTGSDRTESIDYELTIRDMINGFSYAALPLLPEYKINERQFSIGEHLWLPDNSLLFSTIIGGENIKSEIWRLYPESKQLEKVIANAFIANPF